MTGAARHSNPSGVSLSGALLADQVRLSSELFAEGIPWAWMLELLLAAAGGNAGVIVDARAEGEPGPRAIVGELGASEIAAFRAGRPGDTAWVCLPLVHAAQTEALAWIREGACEGELPRWVGLIGPLWAAMIAARRAEERRRATEVSYRELFNGAADLLIVVDPGLRIVEVNHRACEVLGYRREEILDRPADALLAEPISPDERAARVARLDRGETLRVSRPLRHRDGSTRWFEVASRRLPDGRYVSIARDVHEERTAAERLARSEENFRTLIEAMPDGIVIHRDGVVVYGNPAARLLFRVPAGESLEGRSVLAMVHPDDRDLAAARIRAMAADALAVPPVEERFLCCDGSVMHLEVTAMRTVFQGEPAIVAIGRDRSEARRTRAELAHADRVATVGRLAAGVAHEINNPLTWATLHLGAVTAAVTTMQRSPTAPSGEALRSLGESLRTATEGLERVRRIAVDLKTYARQDDDRAEPVDVHATLESALNLASHELLHRARVVRDFEPLGRVRGIEGRLCQVFLNLLVNAAQAIPEDDGRVHEVRVRTRVEGEAVRIDVIDDGAGIAPAVRARIFEPFFSTRRASDGTGLGLSISMDIIAAHGGRIEVDTAEGRGSTFSVFLPAELGVETPPARRPRVLVVDDQPAVLASVARALVEAYAVTTVGAPDDALRMLGSGADFDLVLCEARLLSLVEPDLLEASRARWADLATRVLWLVGGPVEARVRPPWPGQGVLTKPFDAVSLRSAVEAARRALGAPTPARAPERS